MRTSMRMQALGRLVVIAVALGLGTSALAAPSWDDAASDLRAARLPASQVEAIVTQAENRGVPPEAVRAWAERMRQSQQAGVPAALMGERLVQGLVKGVPTARIDQALAVLQANLVWAGQVIDRHAAKAEIRRRPEAVEQAARNIEAALRAGFERAQLEQMLGDGALTLEQITGLAGAAGNLRTWGVAPERAVRALAQAGGAGMTAAELARLERRFAAGIAAGHTSRELMAELERDVEQFDNAHPAMEMDRGDMREDMRHEPMQDFKGPPAQDMLPGPQDLPAPQGSGMDGSGPASGGWGY